MQAGVGRAAGRRNHGRRIFQRRAGHDIARPQVQLQQLHHRFAGFPAHLVARFECRRRAGRAGQGEADGFGDAGHRVGGELAAARAGRRAGDQFELQQIGVVPLAGGMLADAFENVDHGHVLAAEPPRQNGAAVDEHGRHVQPAHRHHHARQALVAAGERHQRVVAVAAHGQLDRIGDDLAADQRGLHALMAHGDAVGHRDGRELARRAPCRRDAVLHRLGLAVQGNVAGRGLVPRRRDADQGLGDLFLGYAHGVEERPMGRALRPHRGVAGRHSGLVEGAVRGHGTVSRIGVGLTGAETSAAIPLRTSGSGGAGQPPCGGLSPVTLAAAPPSCS